MKLIKTILTLQFLYKLGEKELAANYQKRAVDLAMAEGSGSSPYFQTKLNHIEKRAEIIEPAN